jgi:RimJ/RimL family protein N-acetyltransferase
MTPWPPDVILEGVHARLEPLRPDHGPALAEAVKDGELWKRWYTTVAAPEAMAADIDRRLRLRAQGASLPFTVFERAAGEPVGMTTYMNIDALNRRLEIGSTWYKGRTQRPSTPSASACCWATLLGRWTV